MNKDKTTLGSFLRNILDDRDMSANMLAMASGVAESTIRSLLKQGEDVRVPGSHPLVLRAVCDVLGLDHVRIFQMADYIPEDYYPTHLSPTAEYVGTLFDHLSPDQQTMLLTMLRTVSKGEVVSGSSVEGLVEQVGELRRKYEMFRIRRLYMGNELERIAEKFFKNPEMRHDWYIDAVFDRLNGVFQEVDAPLIKRAHIDEVVLRPHVKIVLNMLLPLKELSNSLEKLYWLLHPAGTRAGIETMTSDQKAGIRDLWLLLDKTR